MFTPRKSWMQSFSLKSVAQTCDLGICGLKNLYLSIFTICLFTLEAFQYSLGAHHSSYALICSEN